MIYVMSDIHGYFDLFINMLTKINFSDSDELYILGDVVDRGPEPIKILQYIKDKKNIHLIKGNHEDMFINSFYMGFTSYAYETRLWFRNGGRITHDKFYELPEDEKTEIIEYIKNLPVKKDLEVNNKKYILVHGMYKENLEDDEIIWGRVREYYSAPDNTTVIFGHTGTYHYQDNKPFVFWKSEYGMFGIDCGLARSYENDSQLGCLCLDTMEEFYIKRPKNLNIDPF